MASRNHESREVWAQRVGAWRESGLSGGQFARAHGLKESTLYRWGKVLGEGVAKPRKSRHPRQQQFARVIVKPTATETAAIEVELRSGRIVRVRGTFDAAELQAVVTALESC